MRWYMRAQLPPLNTICPKDIINPKPPRLFEIPPSYPWSACAWRADHSTYSQLDGTFVTWSCAHTDRWLGRSIRSLKTPPRDCTHIERRSGYRRTMCLVGYLLLINKTSSPFTRLPFSWVLIPLLFSYVFPVSSLIWIRRIPLVTACDNKKPVFRHSPYPSPGPSTTVTGIV